MHEDVDKRDATVKSTRQRLFPATEAAEEVPHEVNPRLQRIRQGSIDLRAVFAQGFPVGAPFETQSGVPAKALDGRCDPALARDQADRNDVALQYQALECECLDGVVRAGR